MDQDKLRDILIRHATAARDMGKGLANDIVGLLNSMDDDLVDQISARYARIEADGFDKGPATTKRLEEMLAGVREINTKVYKQVANGMSDRLAEIAAHEAGFAAKSVKAAGGKVDVETVIPSTNTLKVLVANAPLAFTNDGLPTQLMPWLKVQEAGRLRRLEAALQKGIGEGQTTAQIVQRIRGTKAQQYTDGILQTSRKDATTIALTANAAVQNAAREATYSQMPTIRFLEWSSILDGRTSQTCQQRSGTIYEKGKPHPICPAHPRCRSMLIPRRDDKGTKHKPYGEWLREQPEHVQDEVLGKARADVFRANPDFDFAGYFKEGGGYRTLGELRKFDERLFAEGGVKSPARKSDPEPEPVVEAPARLTSVVDPAINDHTIPVLSRKEANKALSARLIENARHPSYDARPEFKGIKVDLFGKAALGSTISDEAASAIVALMPELDRITDAFNVPRLRNIRTLPTASRTIANMGDGALGVNGTHFTGFAMRVGATEAGAESAAVTKLRDEQKALKAELDEMAQKLATMKAEYDRLSKGDEDREARLNIAVDQRVIHAAWKKVADKEFKLRVKIRTMEKQGSTESVSTWKPGDEVKDRPFTLDHYFTGVDKMRSVLYHETGHHIHQMLGRTGRRSVVGSPPLEKLLSQMFHNKFHGAAPGNLGKGLERKGRVNTTYGTSNAHEWFAESFAAYMMGRPDLADPDLVELIERLLDEQKNARN